MRYLFALLLIGGSALPAADQSWRDPLPGPTPSPIIQPVAPVAPSAVTITGPASGNVGEPVVLTVTGLPAIDEDKPLSGQTAWMKLLQFAVSGDGAELSRGFIVTDNPWQWHYKVSLTATVPGVYVVACDWNEAPYGLTLHRIVIGGTVPPKPDDPVPPGPKPKPDDPIPPPTSGLHVIIVDDENERGLLPQSQINIFTSIKVVRWLDANCTTASDGEPAYRFSSNDSLVEGEDARNLELPVWVAGWDAVMKAVKDGKVKLPAWAVTNGTKGVIEPLPLTVDAAISRLEEFK